MGSTEAPAGKTIGDIRALCESGVGDSFTVVLTVGELRAALASIEADVRAESASENGANCRDMTDQQVSDALRAADGWISRAARILNVTQHSLRHRVDRHPHVWPEGVERHARRGPAGP